MKTNLSLSTYAGNAVAPGSTKVSSIVWMTPTGRHRARVERGIHLALDDFGTGQTSLSYLRTLPITCVKVDRSFVRRVPGDSASVAIVTAISAMSHHLGLKVVAEGVETEEHRFLADNGYDQLQGFLFSRPLRVEEVERTFLIPGEWQPPVSGTTEPTGRQPPSAPPEPAAIASEVPEIEVEEFLAIQVEEPALADAFAPAQVPAPAEVPVLEEVPAETPAPAPPSRPPEAAAPVGANVLTISGGRGESEEHLLELAHRDFLTKLYNRFFFDERLEHAVAHADRFQHKVALVLIDLDDFKNVNDTYGHAVGDEFLIGISDRLKKLVRKVDTLARIGGDEFAVVLSELHSLKGVGEFASRLLALLAKPLDVDGRELRVTGSLGISIYPSAGTEAKDLLRQADLALYRVKNSGGNDVRFFAREMDREVQRDLALARELRGAVDRGELFLEYQLQVALETGEMVGAEALLRWNHPVKGVLGPGRLVGIAESTVEIREIGRWVIQSACEQVRALADRRRPRPAGVDEPVSGAVPRQPIPDHGSAGSPGERAGA